MHAAARPTRQQRVRFAATLTIGALLLCLLAACAPASTSRAPVASGKPQTVAELAQYRGADRQQLLEERARQEGGPVVIYSSGTIMKPLLDALEKKYPFFKAQIIAADSTAISRRVVEEYKAARYDVDGFELSIQGLLIPAEQDVLQSYYSPELSHYPDSVKQHQGYWTIIRASYIGLGYNTSRVTAQEVPKGFRDLADPKWRGRMAVSNSLGTGANWVGTILQRETEDFVRSLKSQNFKAIEGSGRVVADLIIAGEVDVSPTIYNSHVFDSQKKGAPIAWVPMESNFVTEVTFAMASHAPHPASTLLLADFALSREGQEMYKAMGYGSAHDQAQSADMQFEKAYFTSLPDYEERLDKWSRVFKEVFLTR